MSLGFMSLFHVTQEVGMNKVRRFALIAALTAVWSAGAWAGQVPTIAPDTAPVALQPSQQTDAVADLKTVGEALLASETTKAQAGVQVADCIPVYTCDAAGCRWLLFCY
jgi:hypothetical protein